MQPAPFWLQKATTIQISRLMVYKITLEIGNNTI